MSMSTRVVGIKPPDEKWLKMKAVWDACHDAGIEPPDNVSEFFDWETPDPTGVHVDIEDHPSVIQWVDEVHNSASGFEVHVKELPKDVTVVRFYNSW